MSRPSFERAKAFLEALPVTWPSPEISADPDGEITFEWSRGPHMVFAVSIGSGNLVSYAGLFGQNKTSGMETLVDQLPKVVSHNLARLFPRKVQVTS